MNRKLTMYDDGTPFHYESYVAYDIEREAKTDGDTIAESYIDYTHKPDDKPATESYEDLAYEMDMERLVAPLLYITASGPKSEESTDDELTLLMAKIFDVHKIYFGAYTKHKNTFMYHTRFNGYHTCKCGERSSDRDYFIEVKNRSLSKAQAKSMTLLQLRQYFEDNGIHIDRMVTKEAMIGALPLRFATNSLCVHYLRWHRKDVPQSELDKVRSMLN